MKKLLLTTLLAAILAFALQMQPARAADSTNVAVRVVETNTTITFYMQFTFLGTGTDSRFSRAINISELDLSTSQIGFIGSGEANIELDVTFHSGIQFEAITDQDSSGASNTVDLSDLLEASLDADRDSVGSATPSFDAIAAAEEVTKAQWLVIEADGQTGNPTTADLSVSLQCFKRVGATTKAFRRYALILDTK